MKGNLWRKGAYICFHVQITAHHCGEVKAGASNSQPYHSQGRRAAKADVLACRLLVFRSFFPLVYSSAPPAHGVMLPTVGWVTPATIKAISH